MNTLILTLFCFNEIFPRNALANSSSNFTLQIKIRPTEETAKQLSGNNLNVIGDNHLETDFLGTASIFSNEKKNKIQRQGNIVPPFNFEETSKEITNPQPLVLENCLETIYKEIQKKPQVQQLDMERTIEELRLQDKNSSLWNKRDTIDTKNSITFETWLEKFKNLSKVKSEERRQKTEPVLIKQVTQTSTTTATPPVTTVQVIPITREVFKDETKNHNGAKNPVTKNDIKDFVEDWTERKERTKIRFTGLPRTENYLIPSLKLNEGFYPFGFMSEFFSFIHPFDFPVGLIKDIVWGKFTFPYSFLQSIKVESTFLAIIIIFACIAMVIPSYLIILGILALLSKSRCDDEIENGALFAEQEVSDCNDKITVLATLFVVLICSVLLSGMVVSNEQATSAVSDSHTVVRCACADVAAWLASAARELYHSIVPPVDLMMHAFREDLRNIDNLLGEPIQQAIASESGIELALGSLMDIIAESEDLSSKITSLRDVSMRAGTLASLTSDRLKDIGRQIENLKKSCNPKDIPLCVTLNANSLDMNMKFDMILREHQLLDLRALGVENLTKAVSSARQEFRMLPSTINTQTTNIRGVILQDIEARRQSVHTSSRVLNDVARHLSSGLHSAAWRLESGIERAQGYEVWRWAVMLAVTIIFFALMLLVISALICGCSTAQEYAKRTLQVSTTWLGLVSLVLWTVVSVIFLVAGHAEIYVCHGLWDSPQYTMLTALLDKPSPLLEENESVFSSLFSDLENVTLDASIKDVLRDCEKDSPAYLVFQLDKVYDINKETSYFEWQDLQRDLSRFSSVIDVSTLKTISVFFGKLLNQMLNVSDVNLAKYRLDYNNPVVAKDLPSLIEQLENVAAQLTDLTTAGRLETLATRTQRLYLTNIKPLEQLKAEIVFKLTELELQLMPFRRKLNVSLSHISTAQFYIDNQGEVIAQKKTSIFVSRLLTHAAGWRSHVLTSVAKQAAKCGPLFNVYEAARTLLCTRYVSSLMFRASAGQACLLCSRSVLSIRTRTLTTQLFEDFPVAARNITERALPYQHGWWVCGFFLGVIWCTALTPLCVSLWRIYARKIKAHEALLLSNMGNGQQTPTTALCESGSNWNTPGPPPPPSSDSW